MSKIRHFNAGELMIIKDEYEPIIDKILYKGDLLLVKGRSKAGKSVFAQQLGYAVSSGEAFLKVFDVTRVMPVCYISGEGFIANWKERFLNMEKLYQLNRDNFHFIELTAGQLHQKKEGDILHQYIRKIRDDFGVFIFDNIMFLCAGGNTNNQEHMGQFFGTVETIKRDYNATAIVVHHDSEKVFITKGGERHSAASPDTSMGHSSISGGITHSFTVERYWSEIKHKWFQKVRAGNCRASWMVQELDLYMIVPEDDEESRLGYTLDVNEASSNYAILKDYIQTHKLVPAHKLYENNDILEGKMPVSTFYFNIDKLKRSRLVKKVKKGKKDYYEWVGAEG